MRVLLPIPERSVVVARIAPNVTTHVHLRLVEGSSRSGSYCAPFFYYCGYPAAGTVESYDTNHLSWNVGMGIDFATYWTKSWFVELQYRRIETSPRPFAYWPVMVGLRF
jgi:hypothetical protein